MLWSAGNSTGSAASLKHLVITIEDLSAYGVAFISLRDNLDLSTPSGRLMMHIIGAMAQFERELIKERVSAGMHAARKRGSRIGRPRTYANAEKIRALRAQNIPWRAIAKQLGIGTSTAIRALQNGEWRGCMSDNSARNRKGISANACPCGSVCGQISR